MKQYTWRCYVKAKKVVRRKGILFPESQLSCFSQRKISLTLFKALPLHLLFFLKSLVFICRENSRVSGILLFLDCPRFCRLMKTRNRRYPRASGMDGVKSGESGAFIFSRRVLDFCDGRRSFLTNENSHLYIRGRRRWISPIHNPYHK